MKNNTVVFTGTIVYINPVLIKKQRKNKNDVMFNVSALGSDLPRNEKGLVPCIGSILDVTKDAPVKIIGKVEDDTVICSTIELTWISEEETIKYLTAKCKSITESENRINKMEKKKSIKGLGKKGITKLVEYFQEKILTLDDDSLKTQILCAPELSGIGPKSIEILLKARTNADGELKAIFDELLNYGVTIDQITKIQELCKKMKVLNTVHSLRNDPYRIMLASDIPLKIVDKYAYDLLDDDGKKKFTATDMKRVTGYVLNELHKAADSGHTYLSTTDLVKRVNRTSRYSNFGVEIPAAYISFVFSKEGPTSLTLDKEKRIVALTKYYNAEIEVATKLVQLLNSALPTFKVTEEEIDLVANKLNLSFGKDQRKAFHILETGGVAILTGGPGTGKTTVINGLITLYKMHYPKAVVKFCAPTGKAAKQLNRSVRGSMNNGDSAVTIHKLINYNPFGKAGNDEESRQKDKNNPIHADVIVIDESSMIEISVMNMLLDAIKPGTLVIFVGDEDQLPCIGAGNCLHDMINSKAFPVYRLIENFRQKGNGKIVSNAKRINKGLLPIENETDFFVYKQKDDTEGYETLCRLMESYYNNSHPFETQLIEPSRMGSAGIFKMNKHIREKIVYPYRKDIDKKPMVGDKVLVTETEEKDVYERHLSKHPEYCYDMYINGDIGTIVTITDEEVILWDGYDDIHYDPSVLNHMDFAYSYTIHKSQGSEADTVIIYLPESMAHMMTRSLLYTSVTRARKKVIIVTTGNALQICIENTSDIARNTRLIEHIQFFVKHKGK